MQKKEKNFPGEKDSRAQALAASIARLCEGLVYISESDNLIEIFFGEPAREVSKGEILRQTGHNDTDPIGEVSFDVFFDRLASVRDWYADREKETAERFAELKKQLQSTLNDPRVFRIGKIRIEIYAVGMDESGRLMGIKTKAVET